MDEHWLTSTEAAAALDVSEPYVLLLRSRGQLTARRIGPNTRGGQWLFDPASVAALRQQRAAAPPKRGRPAHAAPSPAAVAQRRSRATRQQVVEGDEG